MRKNYIILGVFVFKIVFDIIIYISLLNFIESFFLYICNFIDYELNNDNY